MYFPNHHHGLTIHPHILLTLSQGFYRRASANMALGKFKLALKDFEAVKRAKPRDPDALSKYNACNKIVTQQAFERAIAVESSKKNIAESIDLSTMGKSLVIIIFIMIFFGGHQFKSKLNCPMVEATCIFHPINVFLTIYAEKFCKLIFLRITFIKIKFSQFCHRSV